MRLSLLNELWMKMTASPRFPAGTLSCPPVSGQKSLHTPLISDLFFPSLPTSLPVCTVNLCSTPHSSLVRYHFLITCVSFFPSFLSHPALFFPPFTLFTLREVSPSSSASTHGKEEYLFQRQEQREAASGQKHPSIRPPSLPPSCLPPPLPPSSASSQGSVLSGCE